MCLLTPSITLLPFWARLLLLLLLLTLWLPGAVPGWTEVDLGIYSLNISYVTACLMLNLPLTYTLLYTHIAQYLKKTKIIDDASVTWQNSFSHHRTHCSRDISSKKWSSYYILVFEKLLCSNNKMTTILNISTFIVYLYQIKSAKKYVALAHLSKIHIVFVKLISAIRKKWITLRYWTKTFSWKILNEADFRKVI